MSVPVCHRLTAGLFASCRPEDNVKDLKIRCGGSDCALWVPEICATFGNGDVEFYPREDGSRTPSSGETYRGNGPPCWYKRRPSGLGWCADNLHREPWPDPAKEEE